MLEPPANAMLTVSSPEVATMLGQALEAIGTENLQLSLHYADSAHKLSSLGGVDFLELQKVWNEILKPSARVLKALISSYNFLLTTPYGGISCGMVPHLDLVFFVEFVLMVNYQ